MDKLIKSIIVTILIFMALFLGEANAKILFVIKQVEINSIFDWTYAIIKGVIFSLSTVLIISTYDNNDSNLSKLVKLLFLALDGVLVYIYYHYPPEMWREYASFAYPAYIIIVLGFIGSLANKYFRSEKHPFEIKFEETQLKLNEIRLKYENKSKECNLIQKQLRIKEIKDRMNGLKRTGRGSGKWEADPNRVEQMEELQTELNKLENG